MTDCTCPACATHLAWLRSLTPDHVNLDRAARMSDSELVMAQHVRQGEAA